MKKPAATALRRQSPHPRTAIGREQRARTRANIISVAIHIFAEHGPHRPVIDDFVKAAGVSRGTFYNYFSTVHDLLEAAVNSVSNDYIAQILPLVDGIDNPVVRFVCAQRLFQQRARNDTVFAAFVGSIPTVSSRIDARLHVDIEEAIKKGLISVHSVEAAVIAAAGIGQYALQYLVPRRHREVIPDLELVRLVLSAWGVSKPLINKALEAPVPTLKFEPLKRHS